MKRHPSALFCPGALMEGVTRAALKGHIISMEGHPVLTKVLLRYTSDVAWACMQSQLGPLSANCQAMALEKAAVQTENARLRAANQSLMQQV